MTGKTASDGRPAGVQRFRVLLRPESIALALILLAAAVVRFRLLGIPLERDEGGFAYIGRLILRGSPLYHDAYDFKPPGLYLAYAAIMAIFGETPSGIHAGFLVVNLASIVLLYLIAKSYFDSRSALVAAFVFALLSITPNVLGFAGHATHLVVLCTLTGYYLLRRVSPRRKMMSYFLAGASFGLAGMVKQPGILFLAFGVMLVFEAKVRGGLPPGVLRPMIALIGGAAVMTGVLVGWVALAGDFTKFIFWNFTYSTTFGSRMDIGDAFRQCLLVGGQVIHNYVLLWVLGGIGLLLFCLRIRSEGFRLSLPVFALLSFAVVSVGFMYRSHYFIMLIPAIALFAAYAAGSVRERMGRIGQAVFVVGLLAAAGWGIAGDTRYFLSDSPVTISRSIYAPNIFSESAEIADTIRAQTAPGDRVAILGSEPQVLFLADRPSATRYIFTYFFMEIHPYALEMQKECIQEITASDPAMVLLVRQQISWGVRPASDRTVLSWMIPFLHERYEPVGMIDLPGPETMVKRWGINVKSYPRLASADILLFRRKR